MAAITLSGVSKVFAGAKRAVADLDLEIGDGELMVLVGPSGCGKTTTLRMIAGLEEPTAGEIRIGGRVVDSLDPNERDVAMIFQNYALYPHMTVFDNLAFPLRAQRVARAEVRSRVERTARLLGLEDLLHRKPRALSGGQRQRVAMGRAIVREPQAFLMDEPLSNLDTQLRSHMRAEVVALQRELGVTTVYVTHDQVEAMTMGTRIAVLRDGVLQQQGPPQELYDRPDNVFVGTFIGSPTMSVLPGSIERAGDGLRCVLGDQSLRLDGSTAQSVTLARHVGADVAVGVRSEHLSEPNGEAQGRQRLRGRAQSVELLGAERLVHIELDMKPLAPDESRLVGERAAAVDRALVTARFAAHATVSAGDLVEVAVRTERLHFFNRATGQAIR